MIPGSMHTHRLEPPQRAAERRAHLSKLVRLKQEGVKDHGDEFERQSVSAELLQCPRAGIGQAPQMPKTYAKGEETPKRESLQQRRKEKSAR